MGNKRLLKILKELKDNLKSAVNINLGFLSGYSYTGYTHSIQTFIGKTIQNSVFKTFTSKIRVDARSISDTEVMKNNKRLFGYGIENGSTIDIVPTLRCPK